VAAAPVASAADRPEPTRLLLDAVATTSVIDPGFVGANHRFADGGYRSWDAVNERPYDRFAHHLRASGIETLRFPGGSVSNMYEWKRAIGPVAERPCQLDARWGRPGTSSEFGIDEHMKLARLVGADTLVTVPAVTSTPGDAADLVEYMNARVGEDPNGDGVDWAAQREINQRRLGEPVGPYGIRTWTVGNEPYLMNQRYWMDDSYGRALHEYAYGGQRYFEDQLVGRGCSRSEERSQGSGRPGQRFRILYPPLRDARVTVGGEEWTRVDDLSALHAGQHVYQLDDTTGQIRFGDGLTGAIPPRGAPVRASYLSVHAGFVDFAQEMHRVDPDVRVCSEWGHGSFVRLLRRDGRHFDCLAAHAYSFISHQVWRSVRDGHDTQMVAEGQRVAKVEKLSRLLRRTPGRPDLLITEYGHLSSTHQPRFPYWESSVSDGLYMTSQLLRLMHADVGLAVGGAVISRGTRGWLSGAPDFRPGAPLRMLDVVSPAVAGRTVRHRLVDGRTLRTPEGGAYAALVPGVTRTGDLLQVILVNRDPEDAQRVLVENPRGRWSRRALIWRAGGGSVSDTQAVVRRSSLQLDPTRFWLHVPAGSVVRVQLRAR